MCFVDSRLVHYCILGRHETCVSKNIPVQQILVKHLNVRVVMNAHTLLNELYFKQRARELYELNVQFLTFFYEMLS